MATTVYPLPMDPNLAREVAKAAKATGLSKAELMRQALAFGIPTVIERLQGGVDPGGDGEGDHRSARLSHWTSAPADAKEPQAMPRYRDAAKKKGGQNEGNGRFPD